MRPSAGCPLVMPSEGLVTREIGRASGQAATGQTVVGITENEQMGRASV